MSSIRLSPSVSIPEAELTFKTSRSSGPGGQSVNTSDSKVELRWSVESSAALDETQRARLVERLASRLTADGVLVLTSSDHRSQLRNREAVVARLRSMVGEALEPPKVRRRTRPSRGSQERRLRSKTQRSEIKRLRRPPNE